MKRIQAVDFIKGIDIVLMVLFNYSVTLSYFGLIQMPSNFLYSFVFPRAIALIFIFFSGVAAYVSYQRRRENFSKRYFFRGAKLLVFALFITFFTYIFVPEGTVIFGILHFFALTSFLLPLFIRYNTFNLFAGALIILSGFYLQRIKFDISYLLWLGLTPANFSTFDYFPLLPWLGVLMLGIYFGKRIAERTSEMEFRSKLANVFMFLGKNSLTIYLLHQPVLVILLMVSGFVPTSII